MSDLKLMRIYCKDTRYLIGRSGLLERLFFLYYSSPPHLTHLFIFLSFARVAFSAALFMRWNTVALLLPIIANSYCVLTWVRHYSKLFVSIILFYLIITTTCDRDAVISPLYRWKHWDKEKLTNLLKDTQLVLWWMLGRPNSESVDLYPSSYSFKSCTKVYWLSLCLISYLQVEPDCPSMAGGCDHRSDGLGRLHASYESTLHAS